MISPVFPHDSADLSFPTNRLEFVSDLLHPPLHGLVICVYTLYAARHESRPLADISFMDPFPEEGDLVVEKGEFDLEFPFPARSALREQFEEDAEAVVALDVQVPLEQIVHRRTELTVEHDHRDILRSDAVADLVELAAADERTRIRVVPSLDDRVDDPMARGPQEGGDLSDIGVEGDQEDVQRRSEATPTA